MNRFFQSTNLTVKNDVILDEKTSHHITRVLRLNTKEKIIIFNGDGYDYLGEIVTANKKSVVIKILDAKLKTNESSLNIHLMQAICKQMDFIIQKSVELGVNQITPILSDYSNIKHQEVILNKKHAHWQNIVISACEQCGRAIIPNLTKPILLEDALTQNSTDLKLILHPYNSKSLKEFSHKTPQTIDLLIGPEGGFSNDEVNLAHEHNFNSLNLGPRILRADTAPICAISLLNYQFEV